jgi:hypothetical protein
MRSNTILAAIAAMACVGTALADFNLEIAVNSKPMKDMRDAKCVTGIGFNAALEDVWSAGVRTRTTAASACSASRSSWRTTR